MTKQEAIDALELYRRNMAHILGENDEKVKVIETCITLVEEIEDTQGWIPVSERVPEEGRYLVTYASGQVGMSTWHKTTQYNNGFDNYMTGISEGDDDIHYFGVVAWMPLIEPYKEVKDE